MNVDMCKFESSQKYESRAQSTDFLKPCRNTSAFKCEGSPMVNWPQGCSGVGTRGNGVHISFCTRLH